MSDEVLAGAAVRKLGVYIAESVEQREMREGLQEAFAAALPDFQAAADRMLDRVTQEAEESR
jgi:hypothetical protein